MLSRIYLIRHGITEGNLNHWYYGSTDLPLTEGGYQMIKGYADEGIYPGIPDDADIYTTGLKRTEQTLEAIYGKRGHSALTKLREIDFGKAECMTYDELRQFDGFDEWAWDKTGKARIADAETSHEFHERIREGLKELIGKHQLKEWSHRHGGEDAVSVVVCHGGVISCIMETLFPAVCGSMWDWLPDPGFGYAIDFKDGEPYMYSKINDIGRLGLAIYDLPERGKGRVDRKAFQSLIDTNMSKGFGYFEIDLSRDDINKGLQEKIAGSVREALVKQYDREKYKLALNIDAGDIRNAEKYIRELGRITPDRLLISGLEKYYDDSVSKEALRMAGADDAKALGSDLTAMIFSRLEDLKHSGKVMKAGIGFSGEPDLLDHILKDNPSLDFVELTVNYRSAFREDEKSQKYYTISRRRYKEILVSSVFDGGVLAEELPSGASGKGKDEEEPKPTDTMAGYAMLKEMNKPKSPVDWALRYVLSLPFVTVCVAATKDPDHAREDLDAADRFRPLSEEEQSALRSSI